MKTSRFFTQLTMIAFGLFAVSCNSDDDNTDEPPEGNDEELITNLVLTFQDTENAMSPQSFTFSDPDGPGGDAPVIDEISIDAGRSYLVTIQVSDASDPNDVEDITAEIVEEDDEHQFFFQAEGAAEQSVSFAYDDEDENGNPVGLSTVWSVATATDGNVRVTLIHEPNKTAEGVAINNPTPAGGETDIEVLFPFTAQ